MEERAPLISFRNADIAGGDSTVIYDLNMDIYPGDFVYIVGKVGTGKTSSRYPHTCPEPFFILLSAMIVLIIDVFPVPTFPTIYTKSPG